MRRKSIDQISRLVEWAAVASLDRLLPLAHVSGKPDDKVQLASIICPAYLAGATMTMTDKDGARFFIRNARPGPPRFGLHKRRAPMEAIIGLAQLILL